MGVKQRKAPQFSANRVTFSHHDDPSSDSCKTHRKVQNDHNQLIVRYFEEILNSSYDGFWILDGEARVIWINDAAEKINGIKRSEVLGRKAEDLVNDGLIDQPMTPKVLQIGKL